MSYAAARCSVSVNASCINSPPFVLLLLLLLLLLHYLLLLKLLCGGRLLKLRSEPFQSPCGSRRTSIFYRLFSFWNCTSLLWGRSRPGSLSYTPIHVVGTLLSVCHPADQTSTEQRCCRRRGASMKHDMTQYLASPNSVVRPATVPITTKYGRVLTVGFILSSLFRTVDIAIYE